MISGGNLSKKDYIETLAKILSKNHGKPLDDTFKAKAEELANSGMYDEYKKTIKKK